MINSSYAKNNFGEVFYSIVTAFQPRVCVELGILDGYSTFNIAKGLIKNHAGHLDAYDLFEDYPFKHAVESEIKSYIDGKNLKDWITVFKSDAFEVSKLYTDGSVSFLHVDISNTGEIVRRIMEQWDRKMVQGGVICFEGGSDERDQEEWMTKYNKEPIKPEIENNSIIKEKYIFGTYLKWPSLTMLLKKR